MAKAVDSPQRDSLYVGDLHPDVSAKELEQTFGAVGQVASVCLGRDKISGRSLCYAFVNFCFHIDAGRALNSLKYTELRGRPMRIMWSERNQSLKKTGIANLFVKNLGPSITGARLQEIFSKFGTVISCKVAEDNGKSKGYGFVQFDSKDSAVAALDAVHGTMQDGKKIYVSKFVRKSERSRGELVFTNLYVKNLDGDVTDDLLKNKFSPFGKIRSAVVMKDENGISKEFGFVNFCSNEEAKKAMEALNGELFGSKNLFVGRAQRKDERAEILRQIYGEKYCSISNWEFTKNSSQSVKNVDESVDDKKLKQTFCAHGRVISAKGIRHGSDGTRKGFGSVQYLNPDDAHRALFSLNGTNEAGQSPYVTMARPREQRSRTGQPLYNANWNVLAHKIQLPPHCNLPDSYSSTPVPKLSPLHPVLYQNFVPPFRPFYPFGATNPQEIFLPYASCKLVEDAKNVTETTKDCWIPYSPLHYRLE